MIDDFLERLYRDGVANDARAITRAEMMLNITPATGKFLEILVVDSKSKRVLEIGTSNGYSTIWLARAAKQNSATVVSLDHNANKIAAAQRNLESAGLSECVALHACDAGGFLSAAQTGSFDFLFLDSDRSQYEKWWPDLRRALRFGTLVADNALSHPHELTRFRDLVNSDPALESVVLPIGKGQWVVRAKCFPNCEF